MNTENSMIIVTGASGHLGRAVAERLLELVPAGQIGVASVTRKRRGNSKGGASVSVGGISTTR